MFVEVPHKDTRPIKQRIADTMKLCADHGQPVTREEAKRLVNNMIKEQQASTAKMYKDGNYRVLVYEGEEADIMVHVPELKGRCTYLSIRREDNGPCTSWTDFQQIKNVLTSPQREAIQLYPAESRVVDAANQYHLLVFPEGYILPFGFNLLEIK